MNEIVCFSGSGVNFYVLWGKTYVNIKEYCEVFRLKTQTTIKSLKDMGAHIYYNQNINTFATLHGYINVNAKHYGKHNYMIVEEIMAHPKASQLFNRNFLQDVIDKKHNDHPIVYDTTFNSTFDSTFDSMIPQNKRTEPEPEPEQEKEETEPPILVGHSSPLGGDSSDLVMPIKKQKFVDAETDDGIASKIMTDAIAQFTKCMFADNSFRQKAMDTIASTIRDEVTKRLEPQIRAELTKKLQTEITNKHHLAKPIIRTITIHPNL